MDPVSAMLGTDTPFTTSFLATWTIGSPFLPHPAVSMAAMAQSKARFCFLEGPVLVLALLRG